MYEDALVEKPDLTRIDEIGFTDLMLGGPGFHQRSFSRRLDRSSGEPCKATGREAQITSNHFQKRRCSAGGSMTKRFLAGRDAARGPGFSLRIFQWRNR